MSTETQEKPKSMFGNVDKANIVVDDEYKNHISSSYPAYMHKNAMEKLEQSIDTIGEALDEKSVHPKSIEFHKRKLSREKKRFNAIKEQIPRFSQSEMSHIKDSFSSLEKEVASAMFTETDMETGKGVDVAEEARRMTEPCIPIDRWLAESCNVKVDKKGRCSRSEAEKVLKIANWHLASGDDKTYLVENIRRKQGGSQAKSSQVFMPHPDDPNLPINRQAISRLEAKIKALEDKFKEEEWECEEDGCNVMITKKTKGVHKGLHVRQAKKEKELVGKE